MGLGEKLLTQLARDPSLPDLVEGVSIWTDRDPWRNLSRFPGILSHIKGRDVLDFGCGEGYQSIACLEAGARSVTGVDTNPVPLEVARKLVADRSDRDRITFVESVEKSLRQFDVIISQDSMEHFDNAPRVLTLWHTLLRHDGRAFVTFGPPWLAPYGAHMHFFTRVPWVHLLFRERAVMNVRARYRKDGATRYRDVPGGLGKLTVGKFEDMVAQSGFEIAWSKRDTIKGLPGAGIPVVREFVTNNIAVILTAKHALNGDSGISTNEQPATPLLVG